MASHEDMVPTGLPYGARKETAAAMRVAGVPLTTASGGSGPPPTPTAGAPSPVSAPPAAPVPPPPVSRAELANFDVFQNRSPAENYQPVSPRQVMMEKVRQSPNAVMRGIYERMAGYKEG